MKAPQPLNERDRIEALKKYKILDSLPEESFDDITKLAALICQTPISLITFIDEDRQWFKSSIGITVKETPRDVSFCAHAILNPREILIVEDTKLDPRFSENPFVTGKPNVRFYAGMPLVTKESFSLGTLCVLDVVPRTLSDQQKFALDALQRQVMSMLELKLNNQRLEKLLIERNAALTEIQKLFDVLNKSLIEDKSPVQPMGIQAEFDTDTKLNSAGKISRNLDEDAAKKQIINILESVSDSFVALDSNWYYTYLNDKAAKTFNRKKEDLIGKHIWTEFPEGIGQPFYKAYYKAMQEQIPIFLEEYYPPYDRWFENRIYPSSEGLAIFFSDITDRKRDEEELKKSKALYQDLVETSQDIIWQCDAEGRYIYLNPAVEEVFGYKVEEMIGKKFTDFQSPEYAERDIKEFERLMKGNFIKGFETVHLGKSGREIHLVFNAKFLRDRNGNIIGTRGTAYDITGRKKTESELIHYIEKLENAEEHANLGSWEFDVLLQRGWWSKQMYKMLGFDPAKEVPSFEEYLEHIHPEDRGIVREVLIQMSEGKYPVIQRFRTNPNLGPIRYFAPTYHFEKNEEGKPIKFTGTLLDITDTKKNQMELQASKDQLRKLAAYLNDVREQERTSISREIHDELGQALTGMKMDLVWLGSRINPEDVLLLNKLDQIAANINSTIQTVRKISSELRPSELDDLGLIAAMQSEIQSYENSVDIKFAFKSDFEELHLNKNTASNIFRIFQETLTNIVRHSNAKNVEVAISSRGNEILFSIADDGKGISEAEINNSNSLGLLGMKERTFLLGGKIKISGTPGKRTEVKIFLPVSLLK